MSLFCDFEVQFLTLYNDARFGPHPEHGILVAGMDFQTAYFNWLLDRNNLYRPDFIIDDTACVYGVPILRELALKDFDPEHFVGFVPGGSQRYMNMFRRHGIRTISFEREMGVKKLGFYEWLEAHYGVDLITTVKPEDIDGAGEGTTASGPSRQMGMFDVLQHISSYEKRFLDIGSGKGGAMVLANQFEFTRVDGLEISPGLCDIAMRNLDLLGYEGTIFNQSATAFDGYGKYDVLYMYDPFRGDLFRQVMSQIERCIKDKPVLLVYANPYHHEDVIRNGVFSLVDTVDTDFFHRTVKIYGANGACL